MSLFLYTAWFRDELAKEEDQDYEWPACFLIEAIAAAEAQAWGDHLATGFARRQGTETFLRSSIDVAPMEQRGLLLIPQGYEATDKEIGW